MQLTTATRSWDNERLFTFSDLARRPDLPVQKTQWVFRQWAVQGVRKEKRGKRYKLPCQKIGRVRYTSVEALRDFIRSMNGAVK